MLAWTIYLSFAGALIGRSYPRASRPGARVCARVRLAGLGIAIAGFVAGMGQGAS